MQGKTETGADARPEVTRAAPLKRQRRARLPEVDFIYLKPDT